jgi:hypothetical protein
MTRFASYLSLVLGAAVALQHAACGFDVASPSELSGTAGSNRYAVLASSPSNGAASHLADMRSVTAGGSYDFCAAYPTGSIGCQLCGHEDLSLDPGQEQVTVVDLTQCAGDVTFGHFSVVEYIRGGSQVQSLSLRPGGDGYEMNVRDATTAQAVPSAVVVDPTYTYFGNVPDPVGLKLTVRRSPASRGGRKNLAVVFSSWLSR